jgi:hypothetical protein
MIARLCEREREADAASGELLQDLIDALGEARGDAVFCAISNVVRTRVAATLAEQDLETECERLRREGPVDHLRQWSAPAAPRERSRLAVVPSAH